MQCLSVASSSGGIHDHRSRSMSLAARTTEGEKVVEHSTIIGAIKAHISTRRILKGVGGVARAMSAFFASGLLLDGLGLNRLILDCGGGFGFDVAKAFVVIGVEVGSGLSKVVSLALSFVGNGGWRGFGTRGGSWSVADAGADGTTGGATALALMNSIRFHHAFITLSTRDVVSLWSFEMVGELGVNVFEVPRGSMKGLR